MVSNPGSKQPYTNSSYVVRVPIFSFMSVCFCSQRTIKTNSKLLVTYCWIMKLLITWCWIIAAVGVRIKRSKAVPFSTLEMTKTLIVIVTVTLQFSTWIRVWATIMPKDFIIRLSVTSSERSLKKEKRRLKELQIYFMIQS